MKTQPHDDVYEEILARKKSKKLPEDVYEDVAMSTKKKKKSSNVTKEKSSRVIKSSSIPASSDLYEVSIKAVQHDKFIAAVNEDAEYMQIGAKRIRKELEKYHLTSIDLSTGKPDYFGIDPNFENPLKDSRKIAKVILDIQAYRGRLVSILGELNTKASTLHELREKSEMYIKTKYSATLKKRGSLKAQDEFINYVIWPVVTKIRRLRAIIALAEAVAKNLDSAWFVFNKLADMCETLRSRMETGGGREYR